MMENNEVNKDFIKTKSNSDISPSQSIKDRLSNLNENEKKFLLPLYAAVCSERDFRITDLDKLSQTDDLSFEKKDKYISYDIDIIKVYNTYLDILISAIGEETINKSMVPIKDQ